jgi:DNA-binding transcriptional regulator YhcF (GntR family)
MRWVFENGLPIYLQMITSLKEMIANGTYPPGSRMPSVRELAMEAGVNPNTVQRAFAELERDGLLHTERTNGRNVSEDQKVLDELRSSLAEEAVDDMVRRLKKLGMSGREIASLAAERAEQEEVSFDPEDADTERE